MLASCHRVAFLNLNLFIPNSLSIIDLQGAYSHDNSIKLRLIIHNNKKKHKVSTLVRC